MSKLWNPLVNSLTPYTPGEQPKSNDVIKAKLNTNESPYGPSPKAIDAMHNAINDDLRLYPDSESNPIKEAVANYYNVNANQVFIGNGSDEILAHIFHGLFDSNKPILFPDISYSFYPVYARLYQKEYIEVPLSSDFDICIDDYLQENGGIIFPNPNAPTGKLLPLENIKKLLVNNPDSVVVIDEAYIDFGGESAVSLINQFKQLLVTQTLSKSRGLAGIRVGFAIGDADLITALSRVKNSFNSYPVDRIAMAGATAAIDDLEHFNETCKKIIDNREYLTNALEELDFDVIPSKANFILAKPLKAEAETIFLGLKALGVMVRYFNTPKINAYIRFTIGNKSECDLLIDSLKQLHAEGNADLNV